MLESVAYGNEFFVAVGAQGKVLVSTDGGVWLFKNSCCDNFTSIAFGNGVFLMSGGADLYRTVDGKDLQRTGFSHGGRTRGITFGNGVFVLVREGGRLGRQGPSITTPDGESVSTGPFERILNGISFVNEQFIAVGERGTVRHSSDGTRWQNPVLVGTSDLLAVEYGAGNYVAVGKAGSIVTSTDLTNWTQHSTGLTNDLNDITYHQERFVTVGTSGTILSSMDGLAWRQEVSGTSVELRAVAAGNGRVVALGRERTVLVSTNSGAWQSHQNFSLITPYDVIFAQGAFIAGGNSTGGAEFETDPNPIAVSSDGLRWESASLELPALPAILGLAYGGGVLLAVDGGAPRQLFLSTDGRNWRYKNHVPVGRPLTYGEGTFVGTWPSSPYIFQSGVLGRGFTTPRVGTNTAVTLEFSGLAGRSYRLQHSTNLISWSDLFTLPDTSAGVTFEDAAPDARLRFYRAISP
jgi:hypothetical protein